MAQKFLFDKITKQPFVVEENVAVAEKVRFSENLNKLFPKADAVFENNNQKEFGAAESLSRPEMTILQKQVMFKELNEGNLPRQLKFFSGGGSRGSELKISKMEKIEMPNETNNTFIEYLMTDYACEF